jgi:N,N'-diacetylchitobiose transport system permease protein
MAIAAETTKWSRRRRLTWARIGRASVPYLLILPVVAALAAILGYPIYSLVRLSLEHYTVFWHTLLRTVIFTVVNVGATIVGGTLIALLLVRVSGWVRILVTSGLVLVWAMPQVVAVQVWYWMTNFQNGVVNYVLTELHIGNYFQHDWYQTTFSQLGLVTALIVWGALPFVAITLYAALSQVPGELVEAAEIDGARPWRVFFDVTLPILRPVLLILTSLSILWDFGVFTQPFLLIGQAHINPSNYLMGIYLFEEGYLKTDYGRGAAISLLMLVMVAAMSVVYVRRMVKIGDVE